MTYYLKAYIFFLQNVLNVFCKLLIIDKGCLLSLAHGVVVFFFPQRWQEKNSDDKPRGHYVP